MAWDRCKVYAMLPDAVRWWVLKNGLREDQQEILELARDLILSTMSERIWNDFGEIWFLLDNVDVALLTAALAADTVRGDPQLSCYSEYATNIENHWGPIAEEEVEKHIAKIR